MSKRQPKGTFTVNGNPTNLMRQVYVMFHLMNPGFVRRRTRITPDMVDRNCDAIKRIVGKDISHASMKQHLIYGVGKPLTDSVQQMVSYEKYGRMYMDAVGM